MIPRSESLFKVINNFVKFTYVVRFLFVHILDRLLHVYGFMEVTLRNILLKSS